MSEAVTGDGAAWAAVSASGELAAGQIVAVEHGEQDLVVWRTLAGLPVVMEARCPHEWSHLAAEGFVDGDEIVCTAHFWRFDAAGRGTKVNIKGRRDPKADIEVFAVREREGTIEALLAGPPGTRPA